MFGRLSVYAGVCDVTHVMVFAIMFQMDINLNGHFVAVDISETTRSSSRSRKISSEMNFVGATRMFDLMTV